MRSPWVVLLLLAAGCFPPRPASPLQEAFQKLLSEKDEEYDAGFRTFMNAGSAALPGLRPALTAGSRRGFPVAALFYVAGSGDEVPLELRARHLARFEWPRGQEEQNAIVIPFVRDEIERDLVRTGRPALRLLREALDEDAPTEAKALGVVRVMLRIGGRAAADELASLLGQERDLGGVRVCDVAAGALLLVGRQDHLLRAVSREALARSAREWWEQAKDRPETEWTRQAVAGAADREVLELLVGEAVDDPKEWRARNPDWAPPPASLRPATLLPRLAAGRAAAYAANRALEEATGARLFVPRAERLGELCASLRLWQPPPDLETAWRRYLESRMLRLSIALVGYQPKLGKNHLLWHHESHFHATEESTGKLEFTSDEGSFLLYVRARELGTRLVYGEYHESESDHRTVLRELSPRRPAVIFSPSFKACVVISVEEVPGRRTPRPPEELFGETRRRLRKLAQAAEGNERHRALRALGYGQDPADADFLKGERAVDALLLMGDPAGLEGGARLEPHEIEMALRKASDPNVRARLEEMKGR